MVSFEKDYTGMHGQQNINKIVKYYKIKVFCDMKPCILVYFIGVLEYLVAFTFIRLFLHDLITEAIGSKETLVLSY